MKYLDLARHAEGDPAWLDFRDGAIRLARPGADGEPPPPDPRIRFINAGALPRIDAQPPVHHSRRMDASRAITIMSALAQATRLRTYQLLVECGESGLNSGAIADRVGSPHNTISSHLTILAHAGLVRREQRGREVTYRAVLDEVAELGGFLLP